MPRISTSFRVRVLSKALVIGFLLAIGVVLLFAWLAEEVHEGETLRFDEHVRDVIHAHATPALTSAMPFFSRVGSPSVMTLLSIVSFLILWREALSFNSPTLFSMIFCSVFMADILLAAPPRSLSNVRSS